jgi:hypothetical protein
MTIPLQLKAEYLFSPFTLQTLTNKKFDMSETRTIRPHSCAVTHDVFLSERDEKIEWKRKMANDTYDRSVEHPSLVSVRDPPSLLI